MSVFQYLCAPAELASSCGAECLALRCPVPMHFIGVQDCFGESGNYAALMAKYGISPPAIVAQALGLLALGQAVPPAEAVPDRTA